jgi:hypothetical protein
MKILSLRIGDKFKALGGKTIYKILWFDTNKYGALI